MNWPVVSGVIIVVLALLAVWLITRARRVDRLHRQVKQAEVTVNRHLTARRAILLEAESTVRQIDEHAANSLRKLLNTQAPGALGHSATTESAITRWIRDSYLPRFANDDPRLHTLTKELQTNAFELGAARRFYNQQVAQTQRLRTSPDVLIFHLAGHAKMPQTFDFDDRIE
ncbi:MAG: hypothetical protein Q4D87_00740 [Actinomycetaceae bacterium]|nr:hypothetical protein [Actinomycetaceae bacterium]